MACVSNQVISRIRGQITVLANISENCGLIPISISRYRFRLQSFFSQMISRSRAYPRLHFALLLSYHVVLAHIFCAPLAPEFLALNSDWLFLHLA